MLKNKSFMFDIKIGVIADIFSFLVLVTRNGVNTWQVVKELAKYCTN